MQGSFVAEITAIEIGAKNEDELDVRFSPLLFETGTDYRLLSLATPKTTPRIPTTVSAGRRCEMRRGTMPTPGPHRREIAPNERGRRVSPPLWPAPRWVGTERAAPAHRPFPEDRYAVVRRRESRPGSERHRRSGGAAKRSPPTSGRCRCGGLPVHTAIRR